MATFKVTCPNCGQRVSGDESFLGTTVGCPTCDADIDFPDEAPEQPSAEAADQPPDEAPEQPPAEAADQPPDEAPEQPPATTPEQPPGEAPEQPPATTPEPPPVDSTEQAPAEAPEQPPADSTEKPESPAPPAQEPKQSPASSTSKPPARPEEFPRPKPREESARATPSVPAAPVIPPPDVARAAKSRPPSRTSSAAIWSTVLGLAAWVLCPIGLVFAIPAVVAGHAGRGNIRSSLGKLHGQGLANSGLVLGYLYIVALFFIVILGPWKPIGSFALQRLNEQSAQDILAPLNTYANDHGGKYPPQLEVLTPEYLTAEQLDSLVWTDPGSFPNLKREPYTYYPGHTVETEPNTILISSPYADGAYRRLVGYINGTVQIISEEEFIRRTIKRDGPPPPVAQPGNPSPDTAEPSP